MSVDNKKRKARGMEYSLTEENIPIDPSFPIFMFPHSVSHEPISNLHCHDVLELGVCLKGNGIFVIGNRIKTYEAGSVILISPGVYHRAKSGTGMDDLWYFIYFHPNDWSVSHVPVSIGQLTDAQSDPDLFPLLTMLSYEIRLKPADYMTSIRGLIATIMVHLARAEQKDSAESIYKNMKYPAIDERIHTAMDILINSENRAINIRDLANQCNLSEPHFRFLFKEQVGMSPKHFQTKLRIHMAMNLLKKTNFRVVDISENCGYESVSSFNRHFRKETGLSPLQWLAGQS